MFVCYIPGERASLCYAVGLLSPLATNSRLCSKKSSRQDFTKHERCVFAGFPLVVDLKKNFFTKTRSFRSLIVRAYSCLCWISQQNLLIDVM